MGGRQVGEDGRDYAVKVGCNFVVPKPQDLQPARLKCLSAHLVVGTGVVAVVNSAIKLHDQRALGAEEVGEIPP